MDSTTILHAVDSVFDSELEFLTELVRHPSTRGDEQSAQDFVASELSDRGYEPRPLAN